MYLNLLYPAKLLNKKYFLLVSGHLRTVLRMQQYIKKLLSDVNCRTPELCDPAFYPVEGEDMGQLGKIGSIIY